MNVHTEFIRKLVRENFQLFPCDDNNKPALDLKNFQKELKEFNEDLALRIHSPSFQINHNLAVLTGESSQLVVVDVDIEFRGTSVWKYLLKKYNETKDLDSLKVITPSGGYHYYFSFDKEKFHDFESIYRPTIQGFGKVGIDLIVENGYVMSPFSQKKDGRMYLPEIYFANLEFRKQINPMPEWLFLLFRNSREAMLNRILRK